jgi:hypothetical protein
MATKSGYKIGVFTIVGILIGAYIANGFGLVVGGLIGLLLDNS